MWLVLLAIGCFWWHKVLPAPLLPRDPVRAIIAELTRLQSKHLFDLPMSRLLSGRFAPVVLTRCDFNPRDPWTWFSLHGAAFRNPVLHCSPNSRLLHLLKRRRRIVFKAMSADDSSLEQSRRSASQLSLLEPSNNRTSRYPASLLKYACAIINWFRMAGLIAILAVALVRRREGRLYPVCHRAPDLVR